MAHHPAALPHASQQRRKQSLLVIAVLLFFLGYQFLWKSSSSSSVDTTSTANPSSDNSPDDAHRPIMTNFAESKEYLWRRHRRRRMMSDTDDQHRRSPFVKFISSAVSQSLQSHFDRLASESATLTKQQRGGGGLADDADVTPDLPRALCLLQRFHEEWTDEHDETTQMKDNSNNLPFVFDMHDMTHVELVFDDASPPRVMATHTERQKDERQKDRVGGRNVLQLFPPPFLTGNPASWLRGEEEGDPPSAFSSQGTGMSRVVQGKEATRYSLAKLGSFSASFPSTLDSLPSRLITVKRYVSIAIQSLVGDNRLEAMFLGSSNNNNVDRTMMRQRRRLRRQHQHVKASIRQFVESIVSQWFTTLHVILETSTPEERQHLIWKSKDGKVPSTCQRPLLSGLLATYARVTLYMNADELRRVLLTSSSSSPSTSIIPLSEPLSIFEALPVAEDLYAPFEPRLRCFAMWRECEHPDFCRYACNVEYLLYGGLEEKKKKKAGSSVDNEQAGGEEAVGELETNIDATIVTRRSRAASSSLSTERHRHVAIGCGSNNNFFWEQNVVRLFAPEVVVQKEGEEENHNNNFDNAKRHHGIRFMATFDCTLRDVPCKHGYSMCFQNRTWLPPEWLTSGGKWDTSWVQSSVCLGAHPSARVSTWEALPQLLSLVLKNTPRRASPTALEGRSPSDKTINTEEASPFNTPAMKKTSKKRSLLLDDTDLRWYPRQSEYAAVSVAAVDGDAATSTPSLVASSSSFSTMFQDDVSILKIDIEEGEYRALGEWLRASLAGRSLMTVSQLQLEVHRTHSTFGSPSLQFSKAVWWIEYLRWELAGLGFSMVSREKNHFNKKCYEWVLVHHTFFAQSEAWMRSRSTTR